MRKIVFAIGALSALGCLALAGCAAQQNPDVSAVAGQHAAAPVSPRDRAALTELDHAASTSADVTGRVTRVDCWMPSDHLIGGTAPTGTFSVLCRVHYDQADAPRYKDMTCIGDFYKTPMLTRCYRWAYYSAEPTFEDGRKLASAPPTPFPSPPAAG